jgi:hypothetical protein
MKSLCLAGPCNELDFHFASDDRMIAKVTVMSGGISHQIKVESKPLLMADDISQIRKDLTFSEVSADGK